ncbi:MAG: flagellar biosynthesis protein FlhB [Lachnospiraceae bacterium]|nr:flagellar biosynthesis protein FlhB [Lachnospiraceae bacterium]
MEWKLRKKKAVALQYEPEEDQAPKVIASGEGYLAEKMIEKAVTEDIPVHRDEKLADSLSSLDIGESIPPELYQIVAEILIYVDHMDKIKGKVMPDRK